jgi:hypothetical protein
MNTRKRFIVRFLVAVAVASMALLTAGTAALAQTAPATIPSCQYTTDSTHALPFCSTGQVSNVVVASNSTVSYKFNYPGDSSTITFTATANPIDPSVASAIGVNVYDTASAATPPVPVEIATTLSNQANSDPHQMQFNYSSGTSGPVTLQLFNYSPNPVTFALNDSGLVASSSAGSVTTPVTLELASGAAPAAPAPSTPAAAPQPSRAPAAGGTNPATIPSCQYTTDSTHALPFCSTGQVANITVPSNGSVLYTFGYPGDNSNITFTATINPIDPAAPTSVGFNVFDTTSQAKPPVPVEVVTIESNQANSDPHQMQFNYSSGTQGTVTLQLFNYLSSPVTFALSDSGLVSSTSAGSTTTPVTLQRA